MSNNNLSTLIEDEHQIASLRMRWGHARDSDDWETLAACFHDGATIHISWISGAAKDLYWARVTSLLKKMSFENLCRLNETKRTWRWCT